MSTEQLLARYLSVPDAVESALSGLADAMLNISRAPGAWTIRQIVHHIVDADDMTKGIIKAALGQSGCVYRLDWYDPGNRWAQTLEYARRPVAPALALLRANHRQLEDLLRHLPDGWERFGVIKRDASAPENKITVAQLMEKQTAHALHHIQQIAMTRHMNGL